MALRTTQWDSWLIRFLRAKDWLRSPFRLAQITNEVCALADDGEKRKVEVRIGRTADSVQVDIGDNSFDVIHISNSKKGFKIAQPKGVSLLRPYKQQPLPRPVPCKRSIFLEIFKNLMPEFVYGHWLLVLAFILKALNRDRGSFPILNVSGPQGAGKTILCRRIKTMIDPSDPPFLSPPRNVDDIIVAAFHSYLPVFENMSGISYELADHFCRLATAGGISKRKHYTDHEEAFYKIHRPVIINGIDEPSNRPDFLDRCVTLELKPISDGRRIAETELDAEFNANLSLLLGGLYDLFADCLRILPTLRVKDLPRMTDYALMGVALEKVLGLQSGSFLKIYANNREEQIDNAFWNDDLCSAIYKKLERAPDNRIEGIADELRESLFGRRSSSASAPRSAKGFSNWLKRVEPMLKTKRIVVERPRRSAEKRNIIIRSESPLTRPNATLMEKRAQSRGKSEPKGESYDL